MHNYGEDTAFSEVLPQTHRPLLYKFKGQHFKNSKPFVVSKSVYRKYFYVLRNDIKDVAKDNTIDAQKNLSEIIKTQINSCQKRILDYAFTYDWTKSLVYLLMDEK